MRISLKLLTDKGTEVQQRWSVFTIAKLTQVNIKDPDAGTYVWDIHGDCWESPTPIYDIELACQKAEESAIAQMIKTMAALNSKKTTRKR